VLEEPPTALLEPIKLDAWEEVGELRFMKREGEQSALDFLLGRNSFGEGVLRLPLTV